MEVISDSSSIRQVWKALLAQDSLSKSNYEETLSLANEAWSHGSTDKNGTAKQEEKTLYMAGLGEGFDEEDDSLVFKSNVKVSDLSDTALRSWVATFLLGEPTLGLE
jgi:hypothetical protein